MPKPQRKTKGAVVPGSSIEDIKAEPAWGERHNHRVGYKNNQDRVPGLVTDGESGETEGERQFLEEAMKRHRELRERFNRGELMNFSDVLAGQTDYKAHNASKYPPNWQFVIDTTEDFVKYQQDWPINVKRREKEKQSDQQHDEQEQQTDNPDQRANEDAEQMTNQDGTDRDEDKTSGIDENVSSEDFTADTQPEKDEVPSDDEEAWRQNRGSDQSSKHNSAYRSSAKEKEDTAYKKLREKYTPQEIALLRSLQHEEHYMQKLEENDGTDISPVRIKGQHRIGVDKQDTMTPDNWVPRSANLIRQTGQHPLNAEPELTHLFQAGLITPNELHYVRNHAAVPHLFWETHVLDINDGEQRLKMDDLVTQFEPVNVAVMMACDGLRRGELNQILKSKGFTWGPGPMSNAYWKGARLAEVLKNVKVPSVPLGGRLFVNFEGADEPSEGKYATSVSYGHVMDPSNDVLLAYEMNNTKLPPDHGFPVRLIVPGFVGGRNIKWLARIWISEKENDSHYHIWDNRVLPSFVTEQDGDFAKAMFHHPDTSCNEQNLNSMIARPAQGETLDPKRLLEEPTYRIEGVAFDGGGHKVQRVEVSLDDGETWLYAIRKFPDRPIRHGNKFWTWCFWHVDVDALRFSRAESISVRAFNVFKNTQPRDPIWNIMGMMNNCWYRVKVETENGRLLYRHPVEAGGNRGWMKPSTANQLAAVRQQSSVPSKEFTRKEVEKHDKKDDCWMVVNNNVYDVTSVLSWHPGGAATIRVNSGKLSAETTTSFEGIHDEYAHTKLQECAIGRLTDKAKQFVQSSVKNDKREGLLQPKRWMPVKLIERKALSSDTFHYKFWAGEKLGLGTCQHIEFGLHMRDKMLVRQYTPTRPILENEDNGTFELVIKTYFPDKNQPGGAFSTLLHDLPIGEMVMISGPSGEIEYKGDSHFEIEGEDKVFTKVNLVLGGSGITPGYQLLSRVLRTKDNTRIRVVDANKTEKDILLKEDMDTLQRKHPHQLRITYVLSHPEEPKEWKGKTGHVNADILKEMCFPPGENVVCLLCGPPAMIQKTVIPALAEWGFEEDKNIYGF